MNKTTPIGIIGAMPQEIKTLSDHLQNIKKTQLAGEPVYSGRINDVEVVLIQSGIGKVNATIATALMIERFKPFAIINTGSAGGIDQRLNIGDIVIGSNITHHDVDITAFGYAAGQMAQMPENYLCDKKLITLAKKSASAFSDASIHNGQIVSGDQFISSSAHFKQIKTTFPDAYAVEMEAAAIAQTCYSFALPFVVIRAISDLADEKASASFDRFIEKAGNQSAKMVMNMLGVLV